MDKQSLIKIAADFVEHAAENYIAKEIAISENVAGLRIFEAPIFAFGSADDSCFALLKQSSAIGEHFMAPKEWLHGRIEGQAFINKLSMHLKSALINEGYDSIVPALDERFWSKNLGDQHKAKFTSNWSERHAAFVCGLGTFGLSKGLITSKGVAGRFGSIITNLYLPPDRRGYENIYDYCSMCGKCAKNCPANAISVEKGKDHGLCFAFLKKTSEKYKPRYGCGKCQVDVPCESKMP